MGDPTKFCFYKYILKYQKGLKVHITQRQSSLFGEHSVEMGVSWGRLERNLYLSYRFVFSRSF